MTPHTAFLQAILEAPEDDTPRLIYADWLEEIGNDPLRAEFIRVQVELARSEPEDGNRDADCLYEPPCRWHSLKLREMELLHHPFENPNEQLWTKATLPSLVSLLDRPDIIRKYRYRRGFISEVEITCEDWINYGHHLLAACPLERVNLMDFVFGRERPGRRVYPSHVVRGYSRPMVYQQTYSFSVRKGELFQLIGPPDCWEKGTEEYKIIPSNHLDDIDRDYLNGVEPELRFDVVSIRSNRYT